MTREEGNRLIAEFMGAEYSEYPDGMFPGEMGWRFKDKIPGDLPVIRSEGYWWNQNSLKFHTSWDWLMPVVEKIERLYDEFHGYFEVHIHSNACTIQGTKLRTDPENFHPAYMSDPNAILGTKIESTWYVIVQFIKWYTASLTTNKE